MSCMASLIPIHFAEVGGSHVGGGIGAKKDLDKTAKFVLLIHEIDLS